MSTFAPTLQIQIPYALRVAGFLIGLLMLAWPIFGLIRQVGKMWLIVGMSVGAVLILGCAIAFYLGPLKVEQKAETPADTPLFVECHRATMPVVAPPGGRIFGLNVFPTPIVNGGGGFVELFGLTQGQDIKWPTQNGIQMQAYECKITNYGTTAIFNAEIVFKWIFREAIADKSQLRSGGVTLERDWPCLISKIDTGVANPFIFYTYNVSDKFVDVVIPASIFGTPAGKSVALRFLLTQPLTLPMNLPPLPSN